MAAAVAIVLLMVTGASSFSVPSSVFPRSRALPAAHSLQLRSHARSRLVVCQGDLGKEFEQERKTREEMDKIFKTASEDLKSAAEAELLCGATGARPPTTRAGGVLGASPFRASRAENGTGLNHQCAFGDMA